MQSGSARWIVVAVTLLLSVNRDTVAATVQFITYDRAMKDAPIEKSWHLAGFFGDFLDIPDGKHQISIDAPESYALKFVVTVAGSDISVSEHKASPKSCKPELRVDWPQPSVQLHPRLKNVTTIIVKEPRFGEPTGILNCPLASMLSCNEQKVIVKVTSRPPGAEVLVDGTKQQYQTNVTLSVPYCPNYNEPLRVLIRRGNSVNCMRSITPGPDARVAVSCRLQKPGH